MNSKIPSKTSKETPATNPEVIPDELKEVLKGLPSQKKEQIRTLVMQIQAYQGPLPHPDHLEVFNRLIPNGAERIMAIYEKQVAHRHEYENQKQKDDSKFKSRGQIFGFLMCTGAIGFASFAIWAKQGAVAVGTIIAAIGALAGAFIYDRKSKK